ncbi:uncharacterized protein [Hoplias malabaricus]|uniref:uncharacterized protein isoform X2 n=1 Tax=Hoplias malabaricus TaxID=27720 RepID=UPI00346211A7
MFECSECITVLPTTTTEIMSNSDTEVTSAVHEEPKSTFITVLPAPAGAAEDLVEPPSSETSSGPCEEELEFLSLEDLHSESVVDSSCCCPGLRGMCTSIKKQMGRLFGRASHIFRRVASAPESAPAEIVSPRGREYSLRLQEDGAEPVFSEKHQMAIWLLADYVQLTYFSVANTFLKSPPVYLLLELFTEQHILGFIVELLNHLLDRPIYSGAIVDPQEVYSYLINMAGSLENLRSHAENHSQDFVRILAEAIVMSACADPKKALLFWGCPDGLMALEETPPSLDRGAVVEPTTTRRLRCPFSLPKIKLRWLRRCRM